MRVSMAQPILKAFESASALDRSFGKDARPEQTITLQVTFKLADLRELRDAVKEAKR